MTPYDISASFYSQNIGFSIAVPTPSIWTLDDQPHIKALTSTTSAAQNLASAGLDHIKGDPPACVSKIKDFCPSVYTVIQDTFDQPIATYQVCNTIHDTHCPGVCATGPDRQAWVQWLTWACAQVAGFNFSTWVDNDDSTTFAYQYFIPWEWTVEPLDATATCPSPSSILLSFAVVNIVVALSGIVLGRRTVVERLTFGIFGKLESHLWPLMVLLNIGINVLGNYINAIQVLRQSTAPIWEVILFWFTRPRLSWLSTLLARTNDKRELYISVAASAFLVEVVLQAAGSYYLGFTVHHGVRNNIYKDGPTSFYFVPNYNQVFLMYVGAALWIATVWFILFWVFYVYSGIFGVLNLAGLSIVLKVSRLMRRACFWRKGESSNTDEGQRNRTSEVMPTTMAALGRPKVLSSADMEHDCCMEYVRRGFLLSRSI
ncbi:hypothetical protein BR93DRAFT_978207 [Coniochaeta sp. PMI_546]|nr:hypothetical protein BR93DRAFT_978207 [Coniochaeta sp. PMI_546]